MRTIERSSILRRDYKRETKGRHRTTSDDDLLLVLTGLANDKPLDARLRDHALSGDLSGYREYHSGPTSCSSIESQMQEPCGSCDSVRTASCLGKRASGHHCVQETIRIGGQAEIG